MSKPVLMFTLTVLAGTAIALGTPRPAAAQKVFLNPSNQVGNPVSGGGTEAQFAMANAQAAATVLEQAGFQVLVDSDFTNAPANANSWGADIFVSIHSNAGGGHGTETLYKTTNGRDLAARLQEELLSHIPYQTRGLVQRDNLWVLNQTTMVAALTEVVFHDCVAESGFTGHPPSESAYLRSIAGQAAIGAGIAGGVCAWFGKDCSSQAPEQGLLKGVVYRAPDMSNRIAGAAVSLDSGVWAVSSPTGYWEFIVDPGTYTVTIIADGYQSGSTTRTVGAGEEVWGSIGLVVAEVAEPEADIPDTAGAADAGTDTPDEGPVVSEDVAITMPDVPVETGGLPDPGPRTEDGSQVQMDPGGGPADKVEPAETDIPETPPDARELAGQDATSSGKPPMVLDATERPDIQAPTTTGSCHVGGAAAPWALPMLVMVLLIFRIARRRHGST